MTTAAHLWAIGYDDVERAVHARDVISELGWGAGRAGKYMILLDTASCGIGIPSDFVREVREMMR
jgi:hypothetical protein